MGRRHRYLGHVPLYAIFIAFIGFFSVAPSYSPFQPDEAVIRVSIGHYGQRKVECRQRSAEELQKMAPNMRVAADCPRERSPIDIELSIDDALVYQAHLPPTGLSNDGRSYAYQTLRVPVGTHLISIRMRDSVHEKGFNFEKSEEIRLSLGSMLAIEFDSEEGHFRYSTPKPEDS